MTAAGKTALVSVEDYLAGELVSSVKHEYLGGYVYAMAGARAVHNTIAVGFIVALSNQLRGRRCQVFNSDMLVRVPRPGHTRFYYPDGMVVCHPHSPNDQFQDRPVVIAEVISESTRRADEGEKREAYLTLESLSIYLLIESTLPRVIAYERTEAGFVRTVYDGLDQTVPLKAIGAQLSLAELYERVDFTQAEQD